MAQQGRREIFDGKTHHRKSFDIPEEAQKLIAEWQKRLPSIETHNFWMRYTYSFVDNGFADEILVKDAATGESFSWAPPYDQW